MTKCPICDITIELKSDTVKNELLACSDCGTELEVKEITPFKLEEAPQEEEDWGQ
tara:strand:+ start:99 stop:263 length:165 start_codon:yes stop_codon:yes gene_type:complete